jgi:hypothetical protein
VIVVKGLCFLAPKEHLANKVKRVRAAAEAIVNSIKAPLGQSRDSFNSRVVIACIVEDKVPNIACTYAKVL